MDMNFISSTYRVNRIVSLNKSLTVEDQIPIIDARPKEFFDLGHLPSARNLPAIQLLKSHSVVEVVNKG